MSVYIDPLFDWPEEAVRDPQARRLTRKYGQWSHLMADTQEELIAFAVGKLGMRLGWIQHMNRPDVHFDLVPPKRAKALRCGAIEITARQMSELAKGIKPTIAPTPVPERGQLIGQLSRPPTQSQLL